MSDLVVIVLPAVGTLELPRQVFEQHLVRVAAVPLEPLVDAETLAQQLGGVPVTWLEQAAREKQIPSVQFGRWRRFRRSEVEAAVRAARSGAAEREGKNGGRLLESPALEGAPAK